jgi:putative ABC transport system permease protein
MADTTVKTTLLPKLAVNGIRKNGSVYVPYLLANSIAVAVFFIFSAISQNKLMETLPYANYIVVLMYIGQFLLCVILAPFLSSINSFLIKRRKTELGLYSILGLEKKHIGIIMTVETLITYLISVSFGIIIAVVFSKLVFLLLLNLTGLPVQTRFSVSPLSFIVTLIYFGIISLFNLCVNLFQVSMTNPAELFKSSKKGEKQPKHIALRTVVGIICLGGGYLIALNAKLDGTIFLVFLFAVWLVVMGTHFLFTSGSIAFLKSCMKNKKFYYRKENFITVSGMLYRLKKSASSLVNICIFGTMAIITLICTISLFIGQKDAATSQYPMDAEYYFNADGSYDTTVFDKYLAELSAENSVEVKDRIDFSYTKIAADKNRTDFLKYDEATSKNKYTFRLITLDDYNLTQNEHKELAENEVMIFSIAADYGKDSINLAGTDYIIKEELQKLNFVSKEINDPFGSEYYIIMKNSDVISKTTEAFGHDQSSINYTIRFNMQGSEADKTKFIDELNVKFYSIPESNLSNNKIAFEKDMHSMYGGLLFLGIFFGIIFTVCMVLIMYYKQISEGLEDKVNFDIMQKVGMSDREVRTTIWRQVKMIFFIPIAVAILHTAIALKIIASMMTLLRIYNSTLVLLCAGAVILVFGVFYGISYIVTARAYYKITVNKSML